MEIYVKKIIGFPHFLLFFWFSITILSYTLIIPAHQLQTQQLTMSQIRSHTEYLIRTYNILVLIFFNSKLMTNLASLTVLIRFNYDNWKWFTFWATLYSSAWEVKAIRTTLPIQRYNPALQLVNSQLILVSAVADRQAAAAETCACVDDCARIAYSALTPIL